MKLVIVESPAKAKTIQKYLGKGFKVKSSYGHVRDLPKSKISVDTKKDFEPVYEIPDRAKKHVAILTKAAKTADEIYFATDEDREGEAIAWHLIEILKPKPSQVKRITFDQITKSAIQEAVANPRQIDQHLVDAQQARRVLDRIVGYELSPLLWSKIRFGLSAGRVQSVVVRLIVEREKEIEAFKPQEYWTIEANLNHDKRDFIAKLTAIQDKKVGKYGLKNKPDSDAVLKGLTDATYTVTDVKTKERKRSAPPPFKTSTLQQAAVNQLGYSSKKTMVLAQQLYEGIELGDKGLTGLITYMRTDSLNLATEATDLARQTITKEFGPDYALEKPRVFTNKSKGAQEAHEAIRPSDPSLTPASIVAYLDPGQLKVYRLIWQRMIASQMTDAKLQTVTAQIQANDYTFTANGSTVLFDGFVRALGESAALKETILPDLTVDDTPALTKLDAEQHFTQPPARYSEATLVKTLEEYGIGRPSTYAPTIDTVQKREYVTKNDDKRFEPTEIGTLVNDLLVKHFPDIVDTEFTATMEEDLDKIATGEKEWQPVIKKFYGPFHANVVKKTKEIDKKELTEEKTGEKCPKCGNELVIKLGRYGKFKACTNYPECKHTEPVGEEAKLQEEHTGQKCPDCGQPLVIKRGRYGPFMGCSGYPDCKHITKIEKSTGVKCPACGKGDIIEKKSKRGRTFYACNQYPDCENAYWSKPTGQTCPECKSLLVYGPKGTAKCSSKECKYKTELEIEDD